MTFTLKVGKRYVRRDGEVTAPLIKHTYKGLSSFPFMDPEIRTTYTANGKCWLDELSESDLISEYKPAKPEWRVVIKCESREDARIVKKSLDGRILLSNEITVEKSSWPPIPSPK